MTLLCCPITVTDLAQALSEAAQAAEHGADLVEYRVDTFTDLEDVRYLVERSPCRCIVTCRPTWEGGACDLPDQERIPVLEAASIAGAAYIDVEWVAYQRSANLRQKVHFNAGTPVDQTAPRADRKGLIVSSHDFEGRPARLGNLFADLSATGADVAKIVWTARSVRDNLEAFELLRHRRKQTIALCMGEQGAPSRILAPKFGGFLTFASLRSSAVTAPGQLTLREMLEVYRFRSINAATEVYGVVGHPVSHSLSPHIHNHAFETQGLDAVYVPFPVAPSYEAFKAFMESFVEGDQVQLRGLSVTLPHKENAFRYLRERGGRINEEGLRIGAINTIRISPAGELSGTSTDNNAIAYCVRLGLARASGCEEESVSLSGVPIAILGAGGTGRTAVATLTAAGAEVTVYNRTLERAEAVAREFGAEARPLGELPRSLARVFINTTSVGMRPNASASAWGDLLPKLNSDSVVFDTVYTPIETTFLRQAGESGAVIVPGIEMFAHQAAAQFSFWTGRVLPAGLFRARAERELHARNIA